MSFSLFLRRTNVALRSVALSSNHRSVALHQTHDPVEVPLVDNSAIVRRAFCVCSIKLLKLMCTFFFTTLLSFKAAGRCRMRYQQGEPDALHHLALDAGFTQDVIWSNARLTAVDKLAPGDSPANRVGRKYQFYSILS